MLAGCSTPAPPPGPPTVYGPSLAMQVTASPPFDLATVAMDAVAGDIAADGRAHLLVRPKGSSQVQHRVVGPAGVGRRWVPAFEASGSLAVAFDEAGVLHAVAGRQHRVMRDGVWSEAQPGPPCLKLVRSGVSLYCGYLTGGDRFGQGWRIDLWPLMAPVPVPARIHKLVLACLGSEGWADVAVVEPALDRDTYQFAFAGDDGGALHVLYAWSRGMMFGKTGVSSAWLPPVVDCDERVRAGKLAAMAGETVFNSLADQVGYVFDVAADPGTGTSLNIGAFAGTTLEVFLRQSDRIGTTQLMETPDRRGPRFVGPVRAGAAGDDRFQVLVADTKFGSMVSTLYHLAFRDGAWSSPLAVGDTPTGILHNDAVQLFVDRRGNALAVWPEGTKSTLLRARWVVLPHGHPQRAEP